MCLAIPGQVIHINGREAAVQYPGEVRRAMIGVPSLKLKDYVLVQMGIIMQIIPPQEAQERLKGWEENTSN